MSQLLDSLLDRARRSQCAAGDCAARFVKPRPALFHASVGRHRAFQSMRDVMAYEAGVRSFPEGHCGEIGSPRYWGYRDAELLASEALREAAV